MIERAQVDQAMSKVREVSHLDVTLADGTRHTYKTVDLGRIRWPVRRVVLVFARSRPIIVNGGDLAQETRRKVR